MIRILNGVAIEAARLRLHASIEINAVAVDMSRAATAREADEWLSRQIAFWNRSRGQKRRYERQRQLWKESNK